MKKINKLFVSGLLCFLAICLFGCGTPATTITLGTYNEDNSTFTANTTASDYSLTVSGTNLSLDGTIPYSESTLGIPAGNIVALRFVLKDAITPDDGTSIKTTNRDKESGWNVYDKTALEADGSLIWVTRVSKQDDVQIKIKWNSNTEEVIYTLTLSNTATLATA